MELVYRRAEKKDVQILIDIYNSAFYDDYMKYGECPAFGHTKESMEKNLEKYPKIIAYFQNVPVGVVSYQNRGDGEYYIGCLGVKKEHQGQSCIKVDVYIPKVSKNTRSILCDFEKTGIYAGASKKYSL